MAYRRRRRVWHNEEWWFAIVDVVGVLTDSSDPWQYIKKMRSRDPALDANWGTTCTPLALQEPDGKQRESNCANTEGLFDDWKARGRVILPYERMVLFMAKCYDES